MLLDNKSSKKLRKFGTPNYFFSMDSYGVPNFRSFLLRININGHLMTSLSMADGNFLSIRPGLNREINKVNFQE